MYIPNMEPVYIFCEAAVVRIPLYNYDKQLFSLLIAQGGAWDTANKQFIFSRDKATLVGRILTNVPVVWVDENSSIPKITGFLERPWNSKDNPKPEQPVARKLPDASITTMPEKFPEYWEARLEEELRALKRSKNTITLYIYYNRMLCRTMQKIPEEMRSEDIPFFLASIEKNKDYSAASLNIAISSIKYFYKWVFKNDICSDRKRPRQDKRLPIVLSKGEMEDIITAVKNIKHRLLLMIVYGSGLRVGETVRLQRRHVDIRRKVVTIVGGKGGKDRQTVLPDAVIALLEIYFTKYDVSGWLFPGNDPKEHLTIRAAQKICKNALKKANIDKAASIHSLRHSFATHLLEDGIDIRYIKDFLGHSSIRTTERYTHVARDKVARIRSPLDTITEGDKD